MCGACTPTRSKLRSSLSSVRDVLGGRGVRRRGRGWVGAWREGRGVVTCTPPSPTHPVEVEHDPYLLQRVGDGYVLFCAQQKAPQQLPGANWVDVAAPAGADAWGEGPG